MNLRPSKQSIFAFSILSFVFILVVPYTFDSKLFLGGDNCNYYILADGLANGKGYVVSNMPMAKAANHFPPGYPFLMSLLMRMGITSILALKVFSSFLLLVSSFVFYRIIRQLTKQQLFSIAVSALILLNAHLLEYASIMMSEIPFLLFQLLSVYFLIRWHEEEYKTKSLHGALFVLMLICLIYTRTMGITMLGASVLFILFSKKYTSGLLVLGITLLALAPWQMRSASLGGNSYVKSLFLTKPYDSKSKKMELSDWGNRMKKNSERYLSKEIPSSLFPSLKVTYHDPKTKEVTTASMGLWLIGISIVLLVFLGILSQKKYRWLFLFIFGGNLLVYLLWPEVWYGVRFILPMIPLILLFTLLGIVFILTKIFRKSETIAQSPYVIILIAVLVSASQIKGISKLQEKAEAPHPRNWSNYIKLAEWAEGNLKNAVISTRKPGIFYVSGGGEHSTLSFRSTLNKKDFFDYFNEQGVTHVVVENLGYGQTHSFLLPMVRQDNQQFKLIKSFGVIDRKDKNGNPLPSPTAVWLFEYNPDYGYRGSYNKDGKRHGKGEYHLRDGRKQVGIWKNDTLHGPGIFYDFKDKTYTGTWKDGKKHGRFIIQQAGSPSIEAIWKNDKVEKVGYILDAQGKRIQQINTY